jgi:hypothetical protein
MSDDNLGFTRQTKSWFCAGCSRRGSFWQEWENKGHGVGHPDLHRATCAVHGHKIDISGFAMVRSTVGASYGRGISQAAPRSVDLRGVDPRGRVILNKQVHVT